MDVFFPKLPKDVTPQRVVDVEIDHSAKPVALRNYKTCFASLDELDVRQSVKRRSLKIIH